MNSYEQKQFELYNQLVRSFYNLLAKQILIEEYLPNPIVIFSCPKANEEIEIVIHDCLLLLIL